jgi:filamentous hemagglutinin
MAAVLHLRDSVLPGSSPAALGRAASAQRRSVGPHPLQRAAQVVAYKAAPASQRPTVLTAGNGVPLVNIQTPSAAGVSRNTYEPVRRANARASSSTTAAPIPTQLGGWVQGNPWLARGSARVILNEVISANPSQLLGYVEVAGSARRSSLPTRRASPATAAASSTPAAPRSPPARPSSAATSTATASKAAPSVFEGAGMDASRVGYTDLIARAVEVNAGIWAQTLKVTAGTNVVDAG